MDPAEKKSRRLYQILRTDVVDLTVVVRYLHDVVVPELLEACLQDLT